MNSEDGVSTTFRLSHGSLNLRVRLRNERGAEVVRWNSVLGIGEEGWEGRERVGGRAGRRV